MWTRDQIGHLPEAELRTTVLLPLLKAMGYLDVFEYHGGTLEQGKDLVMWKRDPLQGRVNYAVVAKAQKISGAAEGKDSSGGLVMQIQQSFGRPYSDPRTGEERRVHHVIVISSKELKKEAIHAVTSALQPAGIDRHVSFFDGDALWDLISEHMPRAALHDLVRASEVLEEIDSTIRMSATIREGRVHLTVEPKAGHDLHLRLIGRFPESAEGQKARSDFETHFRTGRGVEIDGKFITVEGLPGPDPIAWTG
jgi:hypothetical protein